ncbi:MAG TPA: alpha-amylase family glycosyl hydrolase, partial [Intrasporangium sp.]
TSQWANFVRNHDELTLDQLTDEERQDVFDAFGPEPDMQLFDRGLRRRLPSMLGGDDRRLRLVYSIMFSLPGTPVLFYGEEIGMAENLDVPGRLSVRTPMQWGDDETGGFTDAPRRKLTRPMPDGLYSPERVNVAAQRHDQDSLWWFIRNLIRLRRQYPQIGWSTVEVPRTKPQSVLAHLAREEAGWTMLALHNLKPESCLVDVSIGEVDPGSRLVDLVDERSEHPITKEGKVQVEVQGYGYRWLLLHRPGDRPAK